ncbi:MAG: hypothetical protein V4858_06395 [Pseudomonadota bacterium]
MPVTISTLTHALRKQSQTSGSDIKLSHCQQLLSAAFGYKTLAAHQAAQAAYLEADVLDEVDSVILDQPLLAVRVNDLGITATSEDLVSLITAAFNSCLPGVPVCGDDDLWSERIRNYVVAEVETNDNVIGLIADTNNEGIRETHVPFDLSTEVVPPPEQTLSTSMPVRITLNQDLDRPYTSNEIDVTIDLRIERLGRGLWAAPRCHVTFWQLVSPGPKLISYAQALADAFDLELDEAQELEDVEANEIESNDGMVYGYYFDFSDYASPAVAAKLMAKFGRLNNLRVGPDFFENIERSYD